MPRPHSGDLIAARRWADQAVSTTAGWHRSHAKTRARVAIAQGEPEQAERDLHDALGCVASAGAYLGLAGILECLAQLAGEAGSHREPRDFSARRTPSGNEPARSASKSTKPATIRQSRCRVMLWAARTLTQSGPTVSPFPPTKRSPTPNAGAANARSPRAASVANRYFARTGRTGPGLTLCRVPAFERQCRWPGAGFAKVNARTGNIGNVATGYARGQRHWPA